MDSFQVHKKTAFFYFSISFVLHLVFLVSISNIKINTPFQRTHLTPKSEEFDSIQAERQQSLNQTFDRFYPFFSKKQIALQNPSSLNEGDLGFKDTSENEPFSIGTDDFTIINPHFNAPDLFAISFPSDLEGVDQINLPRNIPLVMPLTLDEAQLKKEIKEAGAFLQEGLLNSLNKVNQMLSSKVLLGKINEDLNPYHLDMQTLLPKSSALFASPPIDLPNITYSHKIEEIQTFLENEFDKLYTPQAQQTYFPKDASIISDVFDIEIKKCEMQNGKYTFFSIQLTPKAEFAFEKLDQDFIYLIDRSNSIPPEVFQSFKRSVSFSLDLLPKRQLFNIAIFDSELHFFSDKREQIEKTQLLRAKTYLETRVLGGLFASTDLFCALQPFLKPQDRVRHIFLFSDGDTFLKENTRIKTLVQCLSKDPNINIHCIATGDQNNLSLLQILSHLNRGEMIYQKQVEKLESMFLHAFSILTSAIATQVTPTIQTTDPDQKVGFFTPIHLMKMLYSKKPYTLYGVITNQAPFELFLQGVAKNGLVTIKKSIDLKTAKTDETIMEHIRAQKELMRIESKLYKNPNLPINDILD